VEQGKEPPSRRRGRMKVSRGREGAKSGLELGCRGLRSFARNSPANSLRRRRRRRRRRRSSSGGGSVSRTVHNNNRGSGGIGGSTGSALGKRLDLIVPVRVSVPSMSSSR
jgi:hypothetical protein